MNILKLRHETVALIVAAGAACTSSSTSDGQPPPSVDAGVTTNTTTVTFAIDSLSLGDTSDGVKLSATAWRSLGYDLDGKTTTEQSVDVCTLAPTAPLRFQDDGIGGRDNAFGSFILPILQSVVGPPSCGLLGPCNDVLSNDETQAIAQGKFTLQIQVVGLSDDPNQTASGLTAQVFSSDALGSTPAFDPTTDWPVQAESLVDSTSIAGGALARFTSAYVTNGTFVAGTRESVTVPLHANIHGFVFTLPIHAAIITFEHTSSSAAASGVLAGVLDLAELTAIFQRQAGTVSTSLCGPAFTGIAQQIGQAVDILMDRSNHAGTPCTGVSFGLGFHATRIANPTTVAAPIPVVDPCADGGTDAASD